MMFVAEALSLRLRRSVWFAPRRSTWLVAFGKVAAPKLDCTAEHVVPPDARFVPLGAT